ncbi:hypothetical protein MTR_7g014365 [Medicago truncatula]|uniref:Uncharacterized protein n=1 Tax=Medicago truncatula TaxID=3880 RepID=A0A072TXR7_MEDTR|nr:hypothetical protein MTR_7g014365 [Medicago truncatula]
MRDQPVTKIAALTAAIKALVEETDLLDEMIDDGFPLTTEPNMLQELISPPNIVPCRATDPKYANNEVYVDLVERNQDSMPAKTPIAEVSSTSSVNGALSEVQSSSSPVEASQMHNGYSSEGKKGSAESHNIHEANYTEDGIRNQPRSNFNITATISPPPEPPDTKMQAAAAHPQPTSTASYGLETTKGSIIAKRVCFMVKLVWRPFIASSVEKSIKATNGYVSRKEHKSNSKKDDSEDIDEANSEVEVVIDWPRRYGIALGIVFEKRGIDKTQPLKFVTDEVYIVGGHISSRLCGTRKTPDDVFSKRLLSSLHHLKQIHDRYHHMDTFLREVLGAVVLVDKASIHILNGTALVTLLQPALETYELFDDIILLTDGQIVYQGPRKNIFHIDQKLGDELANPFEKSKCHANVLTTKKYGVNKNELLKACASIEFLLMKPKFEVKPIKVLASDNGSTDGKMVVDEKHGKLSSDSAIVGTLHSDSSVHKNGPSQFNQWDPGGCALVHWRSRHAWEALYQNENSGSSSSEVEETDVGGKNSQMIDEHQAMNSNGYGVLHEDHRVFPYLKQRFKANQFLGVETNNNILRFLYNEECHEH